MPCGGTFAEICAIAVEADGLTFDSDSVRVDAIRPEDAYGGQRITLTGRLGRARLSVQVDVGIGDDPTPAPTWLEYPSILGMPCPRLRAYRPETVIAEKIHAIVMLGSKNSRMRDFFDIHALANHCSFDGGVLAGALHATFMRRRTEIPTEEIPIGLTPEFAAVDGKRAQWAGFLRRARLTSAPAELEIVIRDIAAFVMPVLPAAAGGTPFAATWAAGGPWIR